MRRLRLVTANQVQEIEQAVRLLREARTTLRIAGAKKSAGYVQRALKSAQGALHHADRCLAHRDHAVLWRKAPVPDPRRPRPRTRTARQFGRI